MPFNAFPCSLSPPEELQKLQKLHCLEKALLQRLKRQHRGCWLDLTKYHFFGVHPPIAQSCPRYWQKWSGRLPDGLSLQSGDGQLQLLTTSFQCLANNVVKFTLKCIDILTSDLDSFDPKTRWSSALARVVLQQFDSGLERRVGFLGICSHSDCPSGYSFDCTWSRFWKKCLLHVALDLTGLKIGGVLVRSDYNQFRSPCGFQQY